LSLGSSKYGFTGKELDETGLNYFGARYYNPTTGRFLTFDNFGGQYIYARNNPLKYVDPDGNWELFADIGKRFAGIGVGIGKGCWDTTYIVRHPIATAKGIGFAVRHPVLTTKGIGYSVKGGWNTWLYGDPYESGKVVGWFIFEVETAIGGAAAAKAVKARLAGKLGPKVREALSKINKKLGPKLAYADDVGRAGVGSDLMELFVNQIRKNLDLDDAVRAITRGIDGSLDELPEDYIRRVREIAMYGEESSELDVLIRLYRRLERDRGVLNEKYTDYLIEVLRADPLPSESVTKEFVESAYDYFASYMKWSMLEHAMK